MSRQPMQLFAAISREILSPRPLITRHEAAIAAVGFLCGIVATCVGALVAWALAVHG
jgi:hypothetical protein